MTVNPLTTTELHALQVAYDNATQGDWKHSASNYVLGEHAIRDQNNTILAEEVNEKNAHFITLAHNLLPRILASTTTPSDENTTNIINELQEANQKLTERYIQIRQKNITLQQNTHLRSNETTHDFDGSNLDTDDILAPDLTEEQVADIVRKFLTEHEDEFGLRDFVINLAQSINITFEEARNYLYSALDTKLIELTPQYTIRLVRQ